MSKQRDKLVELGFEDAMVFDEPEFDSAIIGTTHDGRAVYSYELMLKKLVVEDFYTEEEAAEFIDYNTIRTIAYMGETAPVIVMNLLEF
jgi:hypothetical protein